MTTLWRRTTKMLLPHSVVAIGNFDGLHRGHQRILQQAASLAQQHHTIPVMLTFDPYPQAFFHRERQIARLTTLREKIMLAQSWGCQHFYVLPFNQSLATLPAEKFIENILQFQLKARAVVVGEDFHFGYQRQGNVALLQQHKAFSTWIEPPFMYEQQRISSSWIRETLTTGNLALAQQLLGRPYSMVGRVVYGDQRGRQLGFPTANFSLSQRLAPLRGVFVVAVHQAQRQLGYGVANIGTRPTVDGSRPFLEVHILDFQGNLYGQRLSISFLYKLRDEQRFASLTALVDQIKRDIENGRELINNHRLNF